MAATEHESGQGSRNYRIAIVGAGPGGICLAIRLKQAGFDDFVLLERAGGAGGTWFNNRYPGLACDIPSHLYSFSFEPKPDWSQPYATQAEILAYMQHCVDKYAIGPHIRYGTEVRSAHWDDATSEWILATSSGAVVADVFVSALGMFNEIQWPDIPGLKKDFQGEVLHTARWPQDADLRNKTVAVIGSAASAVQLIPEVARVAKQLHVFQRTANWVLPKDDAPYPAETLAQMSADPSIGATLREQYFAFFELLLTFDKPEVAEPLVKQSMANIDAVKDPATREKLKPLLPLGSQRPLLSNAYYPTFNRPNVELVCDGIESFSATSIRSCDGKERPIDVAVLATGYAANKFLSVIEVAGRQGLHLSDAWREGPQAYLGITTAGFPNLFMLYGPNTNNGSILYMIESQVDYIVAKLIHMRSGGLRAIDVRRDVMDSYNATVQEEIRAVEAWRTVGSKYYRASSGRVVTQWPCTMAEYRRRTIQPDADAYEVIAG